MTIDFSCYAPTPEFAINRHRTRKARRARRREIVMLGYSCFISIVSLTAIVIGLNVLFH